MLIYCPECENGCSPEAPACPKCGHPLRVPIDLDDLHASVKPPPLTQQELWAEERVSMTPPVDLRPLLWSPGAAAVLSLCFPGAGQIYRGRLMRGFAWLLCVAIGYVCLILPGMMLHALCVGDAYSGDPHEPNRL